MSRELFKEAKKQKIQANLKYRRDSILSDKKKERTYSKLFEVVKCQQPSNEHSAQQIKLAQRDNSSSLV